MATVSYKILSLHPASARFQLRNETQIVFMLIDDKKTARIANTKFKLRL